MKIVLVHPSGLEKKIKVGFSWTFLFFGIGICIFRGDFKGLFRIWCLSILTLTVYHWIACFTYNKRYKELLMEKGYRIKYFRETQV